MKNKLLHDKRLNKYAFTCYGHPSLLATHNSTLEFTKDKNLTTKGNCIVGIRCDFDEKKITAFAQKYDTAEITLRIGEEQYTFTSSLNKNFLDAHELVFRRTEFTSPRTLGVRCTTTAQMIPRTMMQQMKNPKQTMMVELHGKKTTQ